MSKNYQITQYEEPLGRMGWLEIDGKNVDITRVHLEEDPAALVHAGSYVLVDYNRSGNPLMEIVTEPVLASPDEAREFMRRLLSVIEYLAVYDNAWCVLKADANVSVKESGFTRVEIKNITGFKEIERALIFEVERQRLACKEGQRMLAQTRGWDAEKGLTYPLREKETEEDYGYIIDPDLVPVVMSKERIEQARQSLPELAQSKAKRFAGLGVKPEDAAVIAADRQIAELFEHVVAKIEPGLASRWIRRELMRVLNFAKKDLGQTEIKPFHIVELLRLVKDRKITDATAQRLMERLAERPFDVAKAVEAESLGVVGEDETLRKLCKAAIEENQQAVEDVKHGEAKAFNFIVGKIMAKTKGKADPAAVKKILQELIS